MALGRKGFFTKYRYMDGVPSGVDRYAELAVAFDQARPEIQAFLDVMHAQGPRFAASSAGTPILDWTSKWIGPLDGASIYTAVTMARPSRIIEIGSGVSTHFMARAIVDHDIACQIWCIDPKPRIPVAALPILAETRVLSAADSALTDQLERDDILFVDSSHLVQEGFDLDIILNRLLPRLHPGVIVHFHDIFLPYGYPADWADRRYNEQNALSGWLMTGGCSILFASNFVGTEMPDQLARVCPDFPRIAATGGGGSLWLRKASPAIRP